MPQSLVDGLEGTYHAVSSGPASEDRAIRLTPGGGAELLEDEVTAAQRKLAEETGLTVSRDSLRRPVATCTGL